MYLLMRTLFSAEEFAHGLDICAVIVGGLRPGAPEAKNGLERLCAECSVA